MVSKGQHPGVHRARSFWRHGEDSFTSLSWFLCDLLPWLRALFFRPTANYVSSEHSSLHFPLTGALQGYLSKDTRAKEVIRLDSGG